MSATEGGAVDDQRFDELQRKRDTAGLSAEEADELGRMMAEREGKPYSNADSEGGREQADRQAQESEYREAAVAEKLGREQDKGLLRAGATDPDSDRTEPE